MQCVPSYLLCAATEAKLIRENSSKAYIFTSLVTNHVSLDHFERAYEAHQFFHSTGTYRSSTFPPFVYASLRVMKGNF